MGVGVLLATSLWGVEAGQQRKLFQWFHVVWTCAVCEYCNTIVAREVTYRRYCDTIGTLLPLHAQPLVIAADIEKSQSHTNVAFLEHYYDTIERY